MTTAERNSLVLTQMQQFRAALPDLMQRYSVKWVVFAGGQVRSVHDNEDDAMDDAMETPDLPTVVAQVAEEQPIEVRRFTVHLDTPSTPR